MSFDTTDRFFRPADVGRIRRNQRQIHVQRLLALGFNALIIASVVLGGMWIYRRTQSDARFAVKSIEVTGAAHTPRAALEEVTRNYLGSNLFKIDIARVQHDLGGLAWVSRIEIEKKLPDTLRIKVVERTPVALLESGPQLLYVDDSGVPFAALTPSVGDADLPLITSAGDATAQASAAARAEILRCVAMLQDLRAHDPQLYSRLSEVRPIAPRGFALYDRELGAVIYANAEDVSAKWRDLYAIVRAEHLGTADIEYADLRFAGRVVIKPVHARAATPTAPQAQTTLQITN